VPDLLQIDLAVGVVLIILATVLIVLRARRERRGRPSARPREVAELAREETVLGPVPVVPGFSEGATGPDPSLNGLDRAADDTDPDLYGPDRAGYEADPSRNGPDDAGYEPDPSRNGPDRAAYEPEPAAREPEPAAYEPDPGTNHPAGPQQAVLRRVSVVADAGPGAAAPAAEPDGPPAADGAVTSSGRVSSYYEGADQPVADYLAELGWAGEPGAAGPG